ncbi:MAG: 13E12 repeat family protein, partial [Actinomycetota bacterium]|nr:13E12 repeat family protein [Actinomycetota bacterium]
MYAPLLPVPIATQEPGDALPLERLESEITELAAHIHAATARFLLLVAEFDRRRGWADWDCKSCAHWLSWRCGFSPNAAREHVRVASRLADMPKTTDAFSRGEFSYSQVRSLSRVVTAENEEELLGIARHATTAQIEAM